MNHRETEAQRGKAATKRRNVMNHRETEPQRLKEE
jgi:hypothetical protein